MTLTFYLLTLKLASESCDVGYLCANFGLPRPLCSRLRPDVRDRQTDRQTDVRQKHIFYPIAIETAGTGGDMAVELVQGKITEKQSVSTPVHSPAARECGLLPQYNEHRIRSRCRRCLTLCLVFTPAALCYGGQKNNNRISIAPYTVVTSEAFVKNFEQHLA